jgi:SAM-dependent methyltransferase
VDVDIRNISPSLDPEEISIMVANAVARNGPLLTRFWFEGARPAWDKLLPRINPRRVLEVGSFEGASTIYLIETLSRTGPLEIHCIDTWEGGIEHTGEDMPSVEARFTHNTEQAIDAAPHPVDLKVHKGPSDIGLARLLSQGLGGYFDFIYIDGSHQAPDVLCDATLGFKLLRRGGVMIFDDYLWFEDLPYGKDLLRCPKPAIDAFVNLHFRSLDVLWDPPYPYQLFIQKRA